MKTNDKKRIELNRATLEFAAKLNQVIIEKGAELLVSVNPMEQDTTGLGNIKLLDLDGGERCSVWFTLHEGYSDYAISAFDAGVSQTYADASEFYDVATRIIYGEG
jgi:hypothetical protein